MASRTLPSIAQSVTWAQLGNISYRLEPYLQVSDIPSVERSWNERMVSLRIDGGETGGHPTPESLSLTLDNSDGRFFNSEGGLIVTSSTVIALGWWYECTQPGSNFGKVNIYPVNIYYVRTVEATEDETVVIYADDVRGQMQNIILDDDVHNINLGALLDKYKVPHLTLPFSTSRADHVSQMTLLDWTTLLSHGSFGVSNGGLVSSRSSTQRTETVDAEDMLTFPLKIADPEYNYLRRYYQRLQIPPSPPLDEFDEIDYRAYDNDPIRMMEFDDPDSYIGNDSAQTDHRTMPPADLFASRYSVKTVSPIGMYIRADTGQFRHKIQITDRDGATIVGDVVRLSLDFEYGSLTAEWEYINPVRTAPTHTWQSLARKTWSDLSSSTWASIS